MSEIWKPVPSLPGVMASSEGRLLLPPSYQSLPNGGFKLNAPSPVNGSITRSSKTAKYSYRGVFSKIHGNIKVHRAVCEAFHGPAPFHRAVVIHLDEDAHNNRPENLRWGTQKENLNMPKFREYCRSRVGAASPRAKWAANKRAAG